LAGAGTNWWDWWFKPRSSESSFRFRGVVGSVLVVTLLLMVVTMVDTSFVGWGVSVSGLGAFSLNDKEVTVVQEDVFKNVTNSNPQITETNSTKTTTTENRPGLINKMLITALIFFLLVQDFLSGRGEVRDGDGECFGIPSLL
jgi:hypothetical protein